MHFELFFCETYSCVQYFLYEYYEYYYSYYYSYILIIVLILLLFPPATYSYSYSSFSHSNEVIKISVFQCEAPDVSSHEASGLASKFKSSYPGTPLNFTSSVCKSGENRIYWS